MSNKKNTYTYLSLFSGCGGFDHGFQKNNFKCIGAFDIDKHVVDVFNTNLSGQAHIHDLKDKTLPFKLKGKIDVLISGSPCQGFSTMGKRKINDPRNSLLLTGGEMAVKLKVPVFICENVMGSHSGKHKKYWKELIELLKSNNYNIKMEKYSAYEFGIPQLRKRIILYAWKSKTLEDFQSKPKSNRRVALSEVLSINSLKGISNHNLNYIPEGSSDYKIAASIKQGQKLCNVRGGPRSIHSWDVPEIFGDVNDEEIDFLTTIMRLRRQIRRRKNGDADPVLIQNLKKQFNGRTNILINSLLAKGYIKRINGEYVDLKNTYNGKYKRIDLNGLSPTVDTRFGSYKHFLHPLENRSFSVREAARIQGFEDSFIFSGPINKQYEMVGNAVPPSMSMFIAKTVKNNILPYL